ncbi:hypothetical protein V8F06_009238 [Rhypophila decipiens]
MFAANFREEDDDENEIERRRRRNIPLYNISRARQSASTIHVRQVRSPFPSTAVIKSVLRDYGANGRGRDVWRQQYQRNKVIRQVEARRSSARSSVTVPSVDTTGLPPRRYFPTDSGSFGYGSEGGTFTSSSSDDDDDSSGHGPIRIRRRGPSPPPRGDGGAYFMTGGNPPRGDGDRGVRIVDAGPRPSSGGGGHSRVDIDDDARIHVAERPPPPPEPVRPVIITERPPPPSSRRIYHEREATAYPPDRPEIKIRRSPEPVRNVPNPPPAPAPVQHVFRMPMTPAVPPRRAVVQDQPPQRRSEHRVQGQQSQPQQYEDRHVLERDRHVRLERDRDADASSSRRIRQVETEEPVRKRGGGLPADMIKVLRPKSKYKHPTWFFMFSHKNPVLIPRPYDMDLKWNNQQLLGCLRTEYLNLHRGWIFRPYAWAHDIGMIYVLLWSYDSSRNSYKLLNKAELVGGSAENGGTSTSSFFASDFRHLLEHPPHGATFGRMVRQLVREARTKQTEAKKGREKEPEVLLMFEFTDLLNPRFLVTLALLTIPMSIAVGVIYGVLQQDVANAISLASYIATASSLFFAILAAASFLGLEQPHVYTPTDELLDDIVGQDLAQHTKGFYRKHGRWRGRKPGSAGRGGERRSRSKGKGSG